MLKPKNHYNGIGSASILIVIHMMSGCLVDAHIDPDVEIAESISNLYDYYEGGDMEASATDIRIHGVPLSAIGKQIPGSVEVEHFNGGTQWNVEIDDETFVVTEGVSAIKERIGALILALDTDPHISTDQRTRAVDELRVIVSHLESRSDSPSNQALGDCWQSLNFTPSFTRNMWYGWVDSTLTWSRWPGPVAPWQNWIQVRAIASGNTYHGDSGWKSSGPFGTTAGVSVTASSGAGPESTYNIVLYAYAFFDSTGCRPLWYESISQL